MPAGLRTDRGEMIEKALGHIIVYCKCPLLLPSSADKSALGWNYAGPHSVERKHPAGVDFTRLPGCRRMTVICEYC
jgi:hypothetical protein